VQLGWITDRTAIDLREIIMTNFVMIFSAILIFFAVPKAS